MSWQDALSRCEGSGTGGRTDWRLPNKRELESLVDYLRISPAIAPDLGVPAGAYWSGSTYYPSGGYAWSVNFTNGMGGHNIKSHTNPAMLASVRCVRGGLTPEVRAVLSGLPPAHTNKTGATITVGGTDIVSYMYKFDNGRGARRST